jgi:hypothetical protein
MVYVIRNKTILVNKDSSLITKQITVQTVKKDAQLVSVVANVLIVQVAISY